VWDDSGNRRLVSPGHTSSSCRKGVVGGIRDGSARHHPGEA
jgi:hypothetical protein